MSFSAPKRQNREKGNRRFEELYRNLYTEFSYIRTPYGEIAGYPVRPGYFEDFGATLLPVGVNFTVHTHHGTSCELLLFHKGEEEPYAVLPFPASYKIG